MEDISQSEKNKRHYQTQIEFEIERSRECIKYWQDLIDKIDNKETYKTVVYMPDIKVEE